MWCLNLNDSTASVNNVTKKVIDSVYGLRKHKDIIDFLSQEMCNPAPDTRIKAIKAGFFATCPGLTEHLV